MSNFVRLCLGLAGLGLLQAPAHAAYVSVTVTIENLARTNSISFAPLRLGFHNGTFDSFNNGEAANGPIISIAEGGSGSDLFTAFAAAEPNALLGSVGGALLPGATASNTFMVDTAVNQYFSFGSMVIPSNDYFIGNDSPTRYRLFDASGNLLIGSIGQQADDIWDAGSEAFDPLNAAFLMIGNNDLRTPQNGVVSFDFLELSGFDGLTTAAGYVFDSQLTASTEVYRISFRSAVVPEPSSLGLAALGLAGAAVATRARRRSGGKADAGEAKE
jgi:hypothetical protein